MKANELRIGNWVEFENEQMQLHEFNHNLQLLSFKTSLGGIYGPGIPHEEMKPIPLAEEWLKKFGFIEMFTKKGMYLKPLGNEITIDDRDFLFNIENKYVYQDNEITVDPLGTPVQYVHQLQNLYFTLTGQELTIKTETE